MSAFDKVIGYEKEKEELYQLCDMAKNPEKYAALGVKLPRGILLHGVPGVGKTLMASALIEEMGENRNRYVLRKDKSNEEFVESISKTFQDAKAHAPSVIFLDDIDKFSADSDSRNPEELIAVQSGIDEVKGADVFVVATANEIRELPRSLRRAGRFDRILEICPPNRKEAVEIVRHYLKDKKVAVMASGQALEQTPAHVVKWFIAPSDASEYMHVLYTRLHELDQTGADLILIETPPTGDAWNAVQDRLNRAAA